MTHLIRIADALESIAESLEQLNKNSILQSLPVKRNRKYELSEEEWVNAVKEALLQQEKAAQLVDTLLQPVEYFEASPEQAQHL